MSRVACVTACLSPLLPRNCQTNVSRAAILILAPTKPLNPPPLLLRLQRLRRAMSGE